MAPGGFGPETERDRALVLDAKRVAAVAFVAVLTCGLLCGVAYVAGRTSAADDAARVQTPASAPPVRINPPADFSTSQSPAARIAPEKVSIAEPEDGLYLQLSSVPPGVAEIMAQGLILNGIDAKLAPGRDIRSRARARRAVVERRDRRHARATRGYRVSAVCPPYEQLRPGLRAGRHSRYA